MVKVTIAEVIQQDRYSVVVLLDEAKRRALPVWIGYWEGQAINAHLHAETATLQTFSYMVNLLQASKSVIEEVRLETLKGNVLYAVTKLRQGTMVQEIEARPGDALALAAYSGIPVFVKDEVLKREGIDVQGEPGKPGKLTQAELDTIMNKVHRTQSVSGLTQSLAYETPKQPYNLDFSEGITGWNVTGSHPQNYECGIEYEADLHATRSVYLKAKISDPLGFGTVMQLFAADIYRGKRLRYSASVKAEVITQWAGLWMRIDGSTAQSTPGFDNMQHRPIQGTRDWARYEVILDVPDESKYVAFGMLLAGNGQARLADVQFDTVGEDVPTTNMY